MQAVGGDQLAVVEHAVLDRLVELVEMADVEAVIALITAFALRLEADTSLARW